MATLGMCGNGGTKVPALEGIISWASSIQWWINRGSLDVNFMEGVPAVDLE